MHPRPCLAEQARPSSSVRRWAPAASCLTTGRAAWTWPHSRPATSPKWVPFCSSHTPCSPPSTGPEPHAMHRAQREGSVALEQYPTHQTPCSARQRSPTALEVPPRVPLHSVAGTRAAYRRCKMHVAAWGGMTLYSAQVLNLAPWGNVLLQLPPLRLSGAHGWADLGAALGEHWLRDIPPRRCACRPGPSPASGSPGSFPTSRPLGSAGHGLESTYLVTCSGRAGVRASGFHVSVRGRRGSAATSSVACGLMAG